jgi:NAD-dependent dihydropyrimidine dehydrogenase PreA subunit
MSDKAEKPSTTDIFQLLVKTSEEEKKRRRQELLAPLGIKEYFVEGKITIDMKTCRGLECKICIEMCPTIALYWRAGEVGITEELCIYCTACVYNCIVDNCIKVTRKRLTGETETYSKPADVLRLQNSLCTKKRIERIKGILPTVEDYLEKYRII